MIIIGRIIIWTIMNSSASISYDIEKRMNMKNLVFFKEE